jgi:hypothetical protein
VKEAMPPAGSEPPSGVLFTSMVAQLIVTAPASLISAMLVPDARAVLVISPHGVVPSVGAVTLTVNSWPGVSVPTLQSSARPVTEQTPWSSTHANPDGRSSLMTTFAALAWVAVFLTVMPKLIGSPAFTMPASGLLTMVSFGSSGGVGGTMMLSGCPPFAGELCMPPPVDPGNSGMAKVTSQPWYAAASTLNS